MDGMRRLCDRRTNRRTNSVETPIKRVPTSPRGEGGSEKKTKTLSSDLSISLRFAAFISFHFSLFSFVRTGGAWTV